MQDLALDWTGIRVDGASSAQSSSGVGKTSSRGPYSLGELAAKGPLRPLASTLSQLRAMQRQNPVRRLDGRCSEESPAE